MESEASGASLRTGTTRPSSSNRTRLVNSLDMSLPGSPAVGQRRKRQHWTRDMNTSLINAYFEATEGETNRRKYAAKLEELWSERYPDKQFAGKQLIAQIKNIKTRKLLAPDEIDMLKANFTRRSTNTTAETIRRSLHRRSITPQQDVENEQNIEEPQTTQHELDETHKEITTLFQQISQNWNGVNMEARPKISKLTQNIDTKETIQAINKAMKSVFDNSTNFADLCHIVYCAALIANTILKTRKETPTQENHKQQKPPWEERLEKKISNMRKEIGVLHTFLNNPNPSKKVEKKLQTYTKKLKLKNKLTQYKESLRTHAENLKQKIAALGNRIRRYHKKHNDTEKTIFSHTIKGSSLGI
ncbi:uncharacterized protein LOC123683058 [Harmonia axyridis]|uniref:uncharacterized protein LOC123683058 n=1 Tax=Harmonia axyridis TaxID=115357 RepID=UPI001E279923|nr:uncharacterized protein LOC123683058 [Harmonia axyridis]